MSLIYAAPSLLIPLLVLLNLYQQHDTDYTALCLCGTGGLPGQHVPEVWKAASLVLGMVTRLLLWLLLLLLLLDVSHSALLLDVGGVEESLGAPAV